MRFVTSFSPEGYKEYGETFIRSWLKHEWPGELWVYYEGERPPIEDKRITYHDLLNEGVVRYLEVIGQIPIFRGLLPTADGKMQRNYRYDAHKFCRKTFAQADAAADYEGHLWWIDSDVEIKEHVPEAWFEKQLEGTFMAYLGRPNWHSCASLVGWDNSHPISPSFWMNYVGLYLNGTLFLYPEWHDCMALDVLRKSSEDFPAHNMAEEIPLGNGPVNVFDAVMMGAAVHKKGNKKHGPQRYTQVIELVQKEQPKRILEIGTWNGMRALEMHGVAPEAEYFGFDLFEDASPLTDAAEKNVKPHNAMANVKRFLEKYGIKTTLYKGNTRETLDMYIQQHGEDSADFIYIDGGHSVETIRSDWEHAERICKPGGTVVFDDYYTEMPEEDLAKWGANKVLAEIAALHDYTVEILPVEDPVKGGGFTKMAVVRV